VDTICHKYFPCRCARKFDQGFGILEKSILKNQFQKNNFESDLKKTEANSGYCLLFEDYFF
jgi:hypothetical protein